MKEWLRIAAETPKQIGLLQRAFQRRVFQINPNGANAEHTMNFGWKQWRELVTPFHFVLAALMLACVSLVFAFFWRLPGGNISVITGIAAGLNTLIHFLSPGLPDLTYRLSWILFFLVIFNRDKIASVFGRADKVAVNLPMYALREEIQFRKNSENWNWMQRLSSCVSFGIVHFSMLIVPLAALPALSLGGAFFMLVYWLNFRKTQSWEYAIEQSATVHTSYNILAVIAGILFIIAVVIFQIQ